MATASAGYRPRQAEQGALHQLVRDHFETFRAQAAGMRDGQGLPRFVEQEFRDFLTCGCLAAGFARFRCPTCRHDRLVAFSCKGRGFCPSCGGRRMTDRAAHLVDHVFPQVPVRQWVLTLPPRIRYVLAWDHALCRTVVGVYLRAVLGWLRAQARRRGVAAGRGGAVAVVQRFGAALNLNVHIHALVMDGVYAADGAGGVRFHPRECADDDVGPLLVTIRRRIEALLIRRGVADGNEGFDAPDRWAEEAPALAGLAAASCEAWRRSALVQAHRSADGAMPSMRRTRRRWAGGTRVLTDSTSMRGLSYRPARVTAWNGCADMRCVRRWGRTGCN